MPNHQSAGSVDPKGNARLVASSVNRMGFALYPHLSAGPNLVFSPLGVYCALRMLYGGAADDTREALACLAGNRDPMPDPEPLLSQLRSLTQLTDAEALSLQEAAELRRELEEKGEWDESFSNPLDTSPPDELRMHLEVATAIWMRKGQKCNPDFLKSTRAMMPLDTAELDFETDVAGARQLINRWVTGRTLGRIESMVDPGILSPKTRAVVGNALHFRGRWEQPFFKSKTGHFYLVDGNRIRVPMMVGVLSRLNYVDLNEFWAVEIPYARRPVSMVIIVPTQHGLGALRAVEARLEQGWTKILDAEDRPRDVILTLPEITIRGGHRLAAPLADLGLDVERAEFSGIGGSDPRIDEILHNAILSIDRHGTGAPPNSVTTAFGRSALSERLVLTVDRPFLFAVLDRVSRVILYFGRVEHPD